MHPGLSSCYVSHICLASGLFINQWQDQSTLKGWSLNLGGIFTRAARWLAEWFFKPRMGMKSISARCIPLRTSFSGSSLKTSPTQRLPGTQRCSQCQTDLLKNSPIKEQSYQWTLLLKIISWAAEGQQVTDNPFRLTPPLQVMMQYFIFFYRRASSFV